MSFECALCSQAHRRRGAGGASFGQTVNPISTRGADFPHHSNTSPPPGFSDLATALVVELLHRERKNY